MLFKYYKQNCLLNSYFNNNCDSMKYTVQLNLCLIVMLTYNQCIEIYIY